MFTLLATWALGAGVRRSLGDRQLQTDCCTFALIAVWLTRKELAELLRQEWNAPAVTVGSSAVALALITVPLAILGLRRSSHDDAKAKAKEHDLPKDLSEFKIPFPKARIFPCETKHARMFPKRHAFEYSYLQCGFPIVPGGVTPEGHDVATGTDQELGSWWLRVKASDYLTRGNGEAGFYGKLQTFMREQNVDDQDWSYAYLVTAPRFFGYSFNPVSFWYIYDQENQLKKMILEVNNTFGERRIYLLNGTRSPTPPESPDSALEIESDAGMPLGNKSRFTDLWMKDFHVSPFNSRKGSYALRAQNPFPYAGYDTPMIDNTITLKSSKDHAKVVARLCCVGTPLDPSEFGSFGAVWFISKWWWVGFVTFPRILKEAFNLFYKRSLHVWFRPEVLSPSLGRLPTSEEVTIHRVFHDYLSHLVNNAQDDFRIILHSSIPDVPKQTIAFTRPPTSGTVKELEIRVLTPAFYSRFVHYAYTSEAFDRECIFTDEKNRTCWVSRPELLAQLLTLSGAQKIGRRKSLDELRWSLLKRLRCAPASPAYNATPMSTEFRLEDIRAVRYSEMDDFVRDQPEQRYTSTYRKIVIKLFLAQRYFLGFPQIITLGDLMFRAFLWYHAARQVSSLTHSGLTAFPERNWRLLIRGTMTVVAGHAYGLLKG